MHTDSLYYHAPCFDGLISAALAQDVLETAFGWNITNFVPVTYSIDPETLRPDPNWLATPLPARTAIVDFLYHPDATFWADHHRSAFNTTHARAHYNAETKNPNRTLLFDEHCPAGAALIWRHLADKVSDPTRYAEMVRWATMTDSATYENAEQAVFGDAPALQIAQTLGTSIDVGRLNTMLAALRRGTIEEVAASPLVANEFSLLRPKIEAGLAVIRTHLRLHENGMIATYETTVSPAELLPRFGAFLLEPSIRYLVSLVHGTRGSKISASRNPWGPPTSAALGTIFERYGGGGHIGVGSLQLPPDNVEKTKLLFQQIIADIQMTETT